MQDQNKQTDNKQPSPQKDGSAQGLSWTRPLQAVGSPASAVAPAFAPIGVARFVSVFSAGLVVGVLVTWGFSTAQERRTVAGQNTANTTQTAGVVLAEGGTAQASFEVAALQAAGKKIQIARAVVTKPTWVVVYEAGSGGAPGRALGASLFTPTKTSGTVTLLRTTVPGKTYLVGQVVDNGNGTFSLSTDKPVMQGSARLLLSVTAQ